MKGKYLVILLLIITFICAFCKYSKNVQVRELFIDDKEVKELFNTDNDTTFDDYIKSLNNLNIDCSNLLDGNNEEIQIQLSKIYDHYMSKLDIISDGVTTDENNNSIAYIKKYYLDIFDMIIKEYNTYIEQQIEPIIEERITEPDLTNTACLGSIIPLKKNTELLDRIDKKLVNLDDTIKKFKKEVAENTNNFNGLIDAKKKFLDDTDISYDSTKKNIDEKLKEITPIIQNLLLINPETGISYYSSIETYCDTKIRSLDALIVNIIQKIKNTEDIISNADEEIKDFLTPYRNSDGFVDTTDYEGINDSDDSIKKHCNIDGSMNGSGVCYLQEYEGCNIKCKNINIDKTCADSEELDGYPNSNIYTNVFGDSIEVHTHSHDHGPNNRTVHTHKNIDDMIMTIENSINIQDQKLENIKNEIEETSSGSKEIPKLEKNLENIKNEYNNILYDKLLEYKELNNNNQDDFMKTQEIYIENKLSDISTLESQLLTKS